MFPISGRPSLAEEQLMNTLQPKTIKDTTNYFHKFNHIPNINSVSSEQGIMHTNLTKYNKFETIERNSNLNPLVNRSKSGELTNRPFYLLSSMSDSRYPTRYQMQYSWR